MQANVDVIRTCDQCGRDVTTDSYVYQTIDGLTLCRDCFAADVDTTPPAPA